MITLQEARRIVLENAVLLQPERIDFTQSLHRVLAEDLFCDADIPAFTRSAVDGYACKREDINTELEIIEIIPAGKVPENIINSGQCSKIMTGGMLPDGADCVIMVEDTEEVGNDRIRFTGRDTETNIRYKAEEVKAGECILKKGKFIRPQEIAAMAVAGYTFPLVIRKVRVGVISTGDELVEPFQKPGLSQIRNSNGYQLISQSVDAGAEPEYLGISSDDESSIHQVIEQALAGNDLILISGGVSMGDFDIVPGILEKTGFKLQFKSIAIQPGRPTIFGTRDSKYAFGLPGNPVSSFVIFELLVKPLVFKLMGKEHDPPKLKLPLSGGFKRKRAGCEKWIPVNITDSTIAIPVFYQGSSHIHALTDAQGLSCIPIGVYEIKPGEIIDVRPI
jgi:molybdopterin molybdotransferase